MPATAGRVRMPANNRVHSSAALQTHGIWQSAIGYDPYAPNKEDKDTSHMVSNAEPDAENAYANFQGLLALAKISNSSVDIDRGACKKCGRVGHLKFQCKNYVKVKDDNDEKDAEEMQVPALVALDQLKGRAAKVERRSTVESSDESEEDDSESSDSEVDSEIERIIAERSGKKISGKGGSSRKKDSDKDGLDTSSGKRKKRGRSKNRHRKREISDSDDSGKRRRKRREHRRKRDKTLDDNREHRHSRRKSRKEKRRRSRRSDSDFETSEDSGKRHRRKTKKAESSSDTYSSGPDDSRMGRDVRKSEKSRKRHHEDDE